MTPPLFASHASFTPRRVVVVTRASPLTLLINHHATFDNAAAFLRARGDSIDPLVLAHQRVQHALDAVRDALPASLDFARVDRDELGRFPFDAQDLILAIGQDGLVANVAQYLQGQPVLGINPDPSVFAGTLCQHPPGAVRDALRWLATAKGPFALQLRTMAQAQRDDGQSLLALNEVFVGHRSHQSARYRIAYKHQITQQTSSGVICSTGTGATAWALAIARQRNLLEPLPAPDAPALAWLVREPFPCLTSNVHFNFGIITHDNPLSLESEMPTDGVAFADGIESDFLEFVTGHRITITIAPTRLTLITSTIPPPPPFIPHRPSQDFADSR